MLQFLLALSAASPMVLDHRAMLAVRHRMGMIVRLAFGCAVAILVYFGVLLIVVDTYPHSQTLGGAVYGAGFVIATVSASIFGILVSPATLSRIIAPGICALAIMFPGCLNIYYGFAATWRPTYLLYVLGSLVGGSVVGWVTFRAREGSWVG